MFSTNTLLLYSILLLLFIVLNAWIYTFAVKHNFKVRWYFASILTAIIFVFAYVFKNFLTTMFEYEMQAVWLFVIIIGVPVVFLTFWLWKQIKSKTKK